MSRTTEERVRRRRSFWPALVLGILFVVVWLIFLFFIPPQNVFVVLGFVVFLFLSFLFLFSLLLGRVRRGLFLSLGVVFFLVLGYYGAGNWLNFILFIAIGITLEYSFTRRK